MGRKTWLAPKSPFAVLKSGVPIQEAGVKGAVDPHISYGMDFAETEAAIAAGASLEELYKLWAGEWPFSQKWFRARLIAWKNLHDLIALHSEAARAPKGK